METDNKTETNEHLENQLHDYKNLLQRLQADFENYRKRVEKEQEEYNKYATQELLKQLLTIIDDLELALKNKESNAFRDGIELIYAKFVSLLEKNGIKKISTNIPFNPELHEPLMQETSDKPEGTIIEEFQAGYTLHNKILRSSKVKISKGGTQQ